MGWCCCCCEGSESLLVWSTLLSLLPSLGRRTSLHDSKVDGAADDDDAGPFPPSSSSSSSSLDRTDQTKKAFRMNKATTTATRVNKTRGVVAIVD